MTRLALALLGPPLITLDGAPLPALKRLKVQALLAFLAVEAARSHRREELTGLLWPDQPEEAARDNLRVTLYRLRQALQESADGPVLHITRETVQFNSASDHWLDVATFDSLLAACRAHAHPAEVCETCADHLTQAIALYRGEFLAGLALADSAAFEEWAVSQREARRRQALDALATLATYYENRRDDTALCRVARRQLELEPWHEAAHRSLMRGLARLGDRAAALAHYETCRRVLAAELGIEPEAETRALAERIRAAELTAPPFAALPPAHHWPTPLTPFIGRERELADIAAYLAPSGAPVPVTEGGGGSRLLTLVGPGGMGKTQLALEAGRRALRLFRDGVFFVALAPLTDPAAMPSAIADALGVTLYGSDPAAALRTALRDKHLLLVLDNIEHLLTPLPATGQPAAGEGGGAGLVVDLLQAAPHIQVIVTSRTRLNVRGEQVYAVEALDYPHAAGLAEAAAAAAVRLFVQSAQRNRATFALDAANLDDVLRICHLVRGMPLGLELAAAWVEMLPLHAIAAEIERSADFLVAEWPDAPARQRSLRAVFDWSWGLLTDVEQSALRQLAVFRGGFTREAALAVGGVSVRMLTSLAQKSWLRWVEVSGGGGRYELHELLRQFAAERLDGAPAERATVEGQHSAFYLRLVADREVPLTRGEPLQVYEAIRSEIDNIRQAWAWASRHACAELLAASCNGLSEFYARSGLMSESEQAFRQAAASLQAAREGDGHDAPPLAGLRERALSKVLALHALALVRLGRPDEAVATAQQGVAAGRASGCVEGEALAHVAWGQALTLQAQYAAARSRVEQALELAQAALTRGASVEALHSVEWGVPMWLGGIAFTQGDYGAAQRYYTDSLRICERLRHARGELNCLLSLADLARLAGDYPVTRQDYEAASRLARRLGERWGEATAQLGLGDVARCQGEYERAVDLSEGALVLARESGRVWIVAASLAWLARLFSYLGDYARAGDILSQLDRLVQAPKAPQLESLGLLPLAIQARHLGEDERAFTYAQRAWQIAHDSGNREDQATALVYIGHSAVGLHRLSEAASAYRQALTLYEALGVPTLAVEARAGLAAVALASGDLAAARTQVEAVLPVLADEPRAGLDEPFYVYLTCYRVLVALDDPRATAVLATGHGVLQEYASHISDGSRRASFLNNVPLHRALHQTYSQPSAATDEPPTARVNVTNR